MTGPLGRLLGPVVPSAVGSVPHLDPAEAAAQALRLHPELPAAPQLPRRSPREAMLPQVAAGMPGVAGTASGRLVLAGDGPPSVTPVEAPLDPEAWAGTLAFLRAAAAAGRTGPLKLQLAGPVTLGLALVAAGIAGGDSSRLAAGTVASRARALVATAGRLVPAAPLVVVLDEPALAGCDRPGLLLDAGAVTGRLAVTLDAVRSEPAVAAAGVHCCGPASWAPVVAAGADLLSFPAGTVSAGDSSLLAGFVQAGGWIAWGCVATDTPASGIDDEECWRRLALGWDGLVRAGCDPDHLRHQAILTPDCGLALHPPDEVEAVYARVARLCQRAAGDVAASG